MNILILGGTVFLGRALVEAALRRGHTLTLFNRGKSNPGISRQREAELLASWKSKPLQAAPSMGVE